MNMTSLLVEKISIETFSVVLLDLQKSQDLILFNFVKLVSLPIMRIFKIQKMYLPKYTSLL